MMGLIKNALGLNLDAHLYEIDKDKVNKVLDLKSKKKRHYEVVEKKIIFATQEFNVNDEQSHGQQFKDNDYSRKTVIHNRDNVEKNYHGSYKFFRDYLTSGYETEDVKEEVKEIKTMLETSRKLREFLQGHFIIMPDDPEKLLNRNESDRTLHSNLFPKTKFMNNFTKVCKLLKAKDRRDNEEKVSHTFKIYSELNKPSDIFSFNENQNFLNTRLANLKAKLTTSYYNEEFFFHFAKNYHKNHEQEGAPISSSVSNDVRRKLPVDYIDSMFNPREAEAFYNLDTFMTSYDLPFKANTHEQDLFENVYGILSRCNYSNFLSYLYSKNNLFKFIYDEFAMRTNINDELGEINYSGIANDSKEKLIRVNSLNLSQRVFKPSLKTRNSIYTPHMEDMISCYYFDKICFLPDQIDEKVIETIFSDKELEEENEEARLNLDNYVNFFVNSMKNLSDVEPSHFLLFNKALRCRIFSQYFDKNDVDEDVRNIQVHKLDKSFLEGEKFEMYREDLDAVFAACSFFFILEVRVFIPPTRSGEVGGDHKFSLNEENTVKRFYLFKMNNENIDRFEHATSNLQICLKFEDRSVDLFSQHENNQSLARASAKNNETLVNSNHTLQENNSAVVALINNPTEKHYSVKRVSVTDEDYLGETNYDILKESLINVHAKKKEMVQEKFSEVASKDQSPKKEKDFVFKGQDSMNTLMNENSQVLDSNQNESKNSGKFKNLLLTLKQTNPKTENQRNSSLGGDRFIFRFRHSLIDYTFMFITKNGLNYLTYQIDTENDNIPTARKKINELNLDEFKDFSVIPGDQGRYSEIALRPKNNSKDDLVIRCYDGEELIKFTERLQKFVQMI